MKQIWKEYENRFNENSKVMKEIEKQQYVLKQKKSSTEKVYGSWNLVPERLRNTMENEWQELNKTLRLTIDQGALLQKEFVEFSDELMGSTF